MPTTIKYTEHLSPNGHPGEICHRYKSLRRKNGKIRPPCPDGWHHHGPYLPAGLLGDEWYWKEPRKEKRMGIYEDALNRTEKAEAKLAERPTLDREAVEKIVNNVRLDLTPREVAVDKILALAPPAVPDWLADAPDPDEIEVTEYGSTLPKIEGTVYSAYSPREARAHAAKSLVTAARWEASARFIERRDAAAKEDQRVEEQAEALYNIMRGTISHDWCDLVDDEKERYLRAIRRGVIPPEGEGEK